jgi:excisionase family DNA binding protein
MSTSYLPTYFRTAAESSDELLTVAEACAELRIKRSKLYMYIHSRQLTSVKLGSRRLIPRRAIQELIEKNKIQAVA